MAIEQHITKTCSVCGIEKPTSEFNKRKDSKDGLRGYCRQCHVENTSGWIARNRQRFNKRLRDDRVVNPSKYHAREYKYRHKDWRAFLDQCRPRTNARRRRVADSMPAWADKDAILEIYKRSQEISKSTGVLHHVDHLVPLASEIVCGLHVHWNLEIIPRRENQSKSNRYWPDMP